LIGGLAGGAINGTIAAFSKTSSGVGRNVWNGDRVADGASRLSLKNSSLLRQQGWARTETGGWSNAFGGDLTFQGVDGTGSLGGNNVGDVVGSNLPTTYYPANSGASSDWSSTFLYKGQIIDRFGKLNGRYFSPADTPMGMRALPYNADKSLYTKFEVLKPFEVRASTIAPAF
jgi:hypothetical protein